MFSQQSEEEWLKSINHSKNTNMNHKEQIEREAELVYDKRELVDHNHEGFEHINKLHTQRCRNAFELGANFALEMERWVKVGEQTPKDYERVLASNGIYQVVCEYKHGCFWDELEQIRGIVIWQPLPNLPK